MKFCEVCGARSRRELCYKHHPESREKMGISAAKYKVNNQEEVRARNRKYYEEKGREKYKARYQPRHTRQDRGGGDGNIDPSN